MLVGLYPCPSSAGVTGSISDDDDVVDANTFHCKTSTKPVTMYPDGSVRSRVSGGICRSFNSPYVGALCPVFRRSIRWTMTQKHRHHCNNTHCWHGIVLC